MDDSNDGIPVYKHGYSVRVKLILSPADAAKALHRCGWQPGSTPGWIRDSDSRSHIRGTAWLTQRRPRNGKLPLCKRNKEWGTVLYGLGVEHRADATYVDMSGVRHGDVDRFCRLTLGLQPCDYAVEYYRAAEWYVCLTPQEAQALSAALESQPSTQRAKQFLVRDYPVHVTVRTRAKMMATLNVYRISRGCTCNYRMELRLSGRRERRHTFGVDDCHSLKDILLGLVQVHDLHPEVKPARWEPRDLNDPAEHVPTDPILERLPASAYRGRPLSDAWILNCHTLTPPKLLVPPATVGMISRSPRIRSEIGDQPSSDGGESTLLKDQEKPSSLWEDLADDLLGSTGHLTEVVLDADQDPTALVTTIASRSPTMIRVVSDGSTWQGIAELMLQQCPEDEAGTLVLVVDDGAMPWEGLIGFDDITGTSTYGKAYPSGWRPEWGFLPVQVKAMAAQLWELFKGLREACERDMGRVVVVTTDARPEHGLGGQLRKTDFFRDARVRSSIGDAGRYHCHVRYRVEGQRIVLVKDEIDGRPGRVVWDRGWGGKTGGGIEPGAVDIDALIDGLVESTPSEPRLRFEFQTEPPIGSAGPAPVRAPVG